ncbi:MAG: tRNA pseudouridine(38-40) synthase TruA [Prevotellaceae bacterium]|nr:tRNA pseudouridine(38-40) synthase TruA [Prevotellaceae bacterium]
MRYFVYLSYDGSSYHGWQVQPNGLTVQEVLQRCLSTLLRQDVKVIGAGRTDTGVHALVMVAHFDVPDEGALLDCGQLAYKLNKILPADIAVSHVERVAADMHARFSAVSRTYQYFVHLRKLPFRRQYGWQLYGDIDFQKMNKAAERLLGSHDFTSFSKVDTDTMTNDCTVTEAKWEEVEKDVWCFSITANRFLRNMVRAVVGTLLEVGRGRMSVGEFADVLEKRNRCSAGESVPGHALFLVDIKYPLKQ